MNRIFLFSLVLLIFSFSFIVPFEVNGQTGDRAMVNCWHIPDSYEACNFSTSMRVPVTPDDPSEAVWIHVGVYPVGGAESVTVYYRESSASLWSSAGADWECNFSNNDYWGEGIPGDTAEWEETIEYYIKVTKSGMDDTYIYNGNTKTTDQQTARSDPYAFSYPAAPTAIPTETPEGTVTPEPTQEPSPTATPDPTVNCWHIPDSMEACNDSTTMRVPETPTNPSEAVWIHTGVYPVEGADSVTFYYREATEPSWSSETASWECNYLDNDYWGEGIPGDTGVWGETIEYYIKVVKTDHSDTFIYNGNMKTDEEATAQSDPFEFSYGNEPTPAATPTPGMTPCGYTELQNPSFEAVSDLDYWTEVGTASSILKSDEQSHDGDYSCKFDNPTSSYSGRGVLSSCIAVTPETHYEMSGWFYVAGEAGAIDDTQFRFRLEWRDSSDTVISTYPGAAGWSLSAFDAWENKTFSDMEAPAEATHVVLLIECQESVNNNNDCYIDDFSFGEYTAPTPTVSPVPTINCWHIPDSQEACNDSTTMRVPEMPSNPSEAVWIHTGVYPVQGADSVTIYYRESTEPSWSSEIAAWECNYQDNDYWGEGIPGDTATWNETVQYYIKVTKDGFDDVFIYDDNMRTLDEGTAQADPYEFAYGDQPTPEPTGTPGATMTPEPTATMHVLPTVNCWHIPDSMEACNDSTTMRVPEMPTNPSEAVWIHTGIYPVEGADAVTIYYRESMEPSWSSEIAAWECNYMENDYWGEGIPGDTATWNETIQYYIKVTKTDHQDTFIYNGNVKTVLESEAQADPYSFVFGDEPTPGPTQTPGPTGTPGFTCDYAELQNPSFEAVPDLDYWTKVGTASSILKSDEQSYDGDYSCKFDNPTSSYGGRGVLSSCITVTPGTHYEMSGWFYVVGDAGAIEDTQFRFRVEWRDSSDTVISTHPGSTGWSLSDFDGWENKTFSDMEAPAEAAHVYLLIECQESVNNNNDCYIDDFSFLEYIAPTPTVTPIPTINCWHIPDSLEACNDSTTMRVPETPTNPSEAVWIHTGVYPVGGADSVTIYYRESTEPSWSSESAAWECNYLDNDYWGEGIPGDVAAWNETVQYYVQVTKDGFDDVYIHNGNMRTLDEGTAQADPYEFTFGDQPTPGPTGTPEYTATPEPTGTVTVLPTVNCWHIPDSLEACNDSTTMRVPETPTNPSEAVWIHAGVHPVGGADTITIYYRESTEPSWSSEIAAWECNYLGNDYWGEAIPEDTAAWNETVQYYVKVTKADHQDTFIYNGNVKTVLESEAQADPYEFTYGDQPTPGPTGTPEYTATPEPSVTATSVPTINCWHIPDSLEACNDTTSMRVPETPMNPSEAVWLHTGVYPIEGADSVTIYYRESTEPAWSSQAADWECNYIDNDYWGQAIPADTAAMDETVQYYIKVTKTDIADTYIYNGNMKTVEESVAQNNPYEFTFTETPPVPTFHPAGLLILITLLSGFIGLRLSNSRK